MLSGTERRYRIAMGMFGLLLVLVWTTMRESVIPIPELGRGIDLRVVVTVVLALLAFRVYLHRKAEVLEAERRSQ